MARTIKRAYARYTESFKAEAVRLASHPGILVQDVELVGRNNSKALRRMKMYQPFKIFLQRNMLRY